MAMKYIIGASAAAILALGTSAYAADTVVNEAYVPTTYDWSGPYIGVQVGYGSGNASTEFFPGVDISFDADGFVAGAYAGWNFQNGPFVYGLETDFNYSDVNGDLGIGGPAGEIGYDWFGSTRGRIGLANDRFLAFATAGVAYAKGFIEGPGGVGSESDTSIGWTAGGGLEYAFTDNLVGRAEYRYYDFGSMDFNGFGPVADFDTTLHTGTIGIAYKF